MWKQFLSLSMVVLVLVSPAIADQKKKSSAQKKPAALTEEEKEILRNREILDNLELLQNFDKIRYFDFFAEKKADQTKEKRPAGRVTKKDASKEQ